MKRVIQKHPNYIVTDKGAIYRIQKDGRYSALLVDDSNGTARVDLDGEKLSVARLVLEAFNPTKDPTKKAWHIDGNPLNNKLENLVWLNSSEIKTFSTYKVETRKSIFNFYGSLFGRARE